VGFHSFGSPQLLGVSRSGQNEQKRGFQRLDGQVPGASRPIHIPGAGVPSIDDVLQGGVDCGSLVLDTAKKIRLDELPVLRTANDENELAHEKNKEDAAAVAAASQSS
jgi:hypothetical protein